VPPHTIVPKRSETVLLVEDDVDLIAVEVFALAEEGYRVIIARNGQAALEELTRQRPALVLLDMRMPGVSGWQFMAPFRAAYGRDIPVVIVTATESAERLAAEVDADDWLAKPFELEQLINIVEKHVRHRRPHGH